MISPVAPSNTNTLAAPMRCICFVHAKLVDETGHSSVASKPYVIRALGSGFKIEGTTDAAGVLQHEKLPDDDLEITCAGATEILQVYYMVDKELYGAEPWMVRLRQLKAPAPATPKEE